MQAAVSSGFQPRDLYCSASALPTILPMSAALMPTWWTDSRGLPSGPRERSSTLISFRLEAWALAAMAGPSLVSGVQMTKPWAPWAARLSMAERTFSPSVAPILIRSKWFSSAAFWANFHSFWNQGSSGCLTRKPILMLEAVAEGEDVAEEEGVVDSLLQP